MFTVTKQESSIAHHKSSDEPGATNLFLALTHVRECLGECFYKIKQDIDHFMHRNSVTLH